ncbi:FAD/FMN-containing dehydrogenase [Saccharopolyspora antimicrobica]|uniref:FAD/FMN-containing dehydrogenase n=1 Tax=Saccharopolyspora antimicrobica TaxID=455193 RepID=A0A1I5H388_9PSEU|nr:D-arabinono-1,4-lactone oxidase [Saccharopolyspora antimicrobica]RKT90103.1 FAD/FMN-containing dehydrogenase [Saccharopolyspora antimicrobica]SFO42506.1 FAD/FMN-containing dehydrogenase [Saccharopolyspora antimicrobica]
MSSTDLPTTDRIWTNWAGNQTCTAAVFAQPRDEDEVIAAVRHAIGRGLNVRVAGAGHSFTPVVTTGGMLLDLTRLTGITATDPTRLRASALAGTTVGDFGPPLWEAGLSLTNQGDIDKQVIAGAIATGTHGSGIDLPSFSAALRRVRLVDGSGEVVEIDESDPRRLRAAQVAIGALGVVLEVELAVSPAYHLTEEISYRPWQEIAEAWDELIARHRHFSFFWCPGDESVDLYQLPAPPDQPMADHCYVKIYDEVEVAEPDGIVSTVGHRVDRAYRIYPGGYDTPFHEMEYMVPAEHGFTAVSAIRELMRTEHPDQRYPIEVRWTAADEAYLSPNHRRATTVISVSGEPGTDYWPFLRAVDERLREFRARPHWGKLHFMTRERMTELFDEFGTFLDVRRELDPDGTFLNDHLRPLLG